MNGDEARMEGNVKKIYRLACAFCLVAITCFAQGEVKPGVVMHITVAQMQKELVQQRTDKIYVWSEKADGIIAYAAVQKPETLAKTIAMAMTPDETTYIYTNDKKFNQKLYSYLRFYAGRHYNFKGYHLITKNHGVQKIDGIFVYRIWAMKVLPPKGASVKSKISLFSRTSCKHPSVVVDIFCEPREENFRWEDSWTK